MSGSSTDLLKILWVVLAVVLATGEIAVPGFFLLPFGLGAAAAAVAAFLGASVFVQVLTFVIASGVFFFALRPIGRRLNQIEEVPGVGANRLLGRAGVVGDAVGPDDPGLVRIDREEWRASPASGQRFEVGDHVVVTDVEGTRVIVVASTAEEVSP